MSTSEPLRIGILTVSDRSARGERSDKSGPAIESVLAGRGWQVVERLIVPDEIVAIRESLIHWCDGLKLDVIFTTGGTGFAPRDITPEATLAVIDRLTPGITEAMRYVSLQVTSHAMLSRSVAGIRGSTIIVNLPGSPKAAVENLQVFLPAMPHAVQLLRGESGAEFGHQAA